MSEWKTYKLGDIGKIITGKTPPTANVEYFGDEYPFITPRDMNTQKVILSTERYLSQKGKELLKNNLLPPKSICISCIGSDLGKVVVTLKDSFTNQQLNSIVCYEKFDEDFIYYTCVQLSEKIRTIGKSSTAVPIVNKTSFSAFEFSAPKDKAIQKEIAQILTSLDDKIELNLQMNQTLETVAQALFKEWFVNFNFPGFDGELVDGLPKGWRMGKLNEVARIEIGRTPPRLEEEWFSKDEKDNKWISIRDMGQSGIYIFNTSEYLTNEAIEKFRIPVIPVNTVVLSFKLTIGRLAITTEKMLSNEAIAQINSTEFPPEYIYLYLKTYNWGSLGSTSSIATAVNSKTIKEMEILIPDTAISNLFFAVIKPVFEKIKYNSLQIQTLTQTRDTLLPKLMTGKIEIQA
jgi:type I restriction enzyme S subunit